MVYQKGKKPMLPKERRDRKTINLRSRV